MTLDLIITKIKASWFKKSWDFLLSINEKIQNWILKNRNRIYLLVSIALFITLFDFVSNIYWYTIDIYYYILNTFILSLFGCLLPSMLICYLAVQFYKEINALPLNSEKRATALLFSALISIVFVSFLIGLMFALLNKPPIPTFIQFLLPVDKQGHITGILGHASVGYILAFLLSLLPSFTLWRFRDQNKSNDQKTASELYENSRKDTNLKDFQQLQKWGVGLETAISAKESDEGKSATSNQNDPLQIAAIHQLGGFFRGEFGEQFQRPAYELLHAIWVNQLVGIERPYNMNNETAEKHRKLILSKTRNAIAHAIITAIFGDGGKKLEELDGKRLTNSPSLINDRDWRGINANSALNLTDAKLHGINFSFSDLQHAKLNGADLSNANLPVVNLSSAHLRGANLSYANLSGANLSCAQLNGTNLTGANLRGTDLFCTNFYDANLSGANLSCAQLNVTNLIGANLSGADLSGADLRGADLRGADLRGADLRGADLFETNISGVLFLNLAGFEKAKLTNCINADKAYIGYYDTDSNSGKIVIDHEKTNALRREFGLGEMTETEERRLIGYIRSYMV